MAKLLGKFEQPTGEVALAGGIVVGSVVALLLLARVFSDVTA